MKTRLKSASYWLTAGSVATIYSLASRLSGMSFVLISAVCASYCIGRGIAEFGKGGTVADYKSPEFTILILSLILIFSLGFDMENLLTPGVNAIICLVGFNIGRGLAEHYRSKISTVFNR